MLFLFDKAFSYNFAPLTSFWQLSDGFGFKNKFQEVRGFFMIIFSQVPQLLSIHSNCFSQFLHFDHPVEVKPLDSCNQNARRVRSRRGIQCSLQFSSSY